MSAALGPNHPQEPSAGRKRRAGSTAPCFGCASRDHPGAVIAASGIASVLDGDLETSFSFSFPSFPRHGTSSVPGWCFLLRYFYFQAPLRVAPPPFSKLKEAFSCQELGIWLRGVFSWVKTTKTSGYG